MDQNTQELFENFTDLLGKLTVLVKDIAQLEDAKAQAAAKKQHHLLDGYIQREQAYILKLRGLEQHRIRQAASLGWDSLTFRQILDQALPEQKEVLTPLFSDLEQQVKRLQQSREAAERIIHVRVHELEVAIARSRGSSYDSSGNMSSGSIPHAKLGDRYV